MVEQNSFLDKKLSYSSKHLAINSLIKTVLTILPSTFMTYHVKKKNFFFFFKSITLKKVN